MCKSVFKSTISEKDKILEQYEGVLLDSSEKLPDFQTNLMSELNKQIVSFTSFFSCSAYIFDMSFLSKGNLSSWITKPVLNGGCL